MYTFFPSSGTPTCSPLNIQCDDVIDRQELKIGLTRLRKGFIEDSELQNIFDVYGKGGSETLSLQEFTAFVKGAPFIERSVRLVTAPMKAAATSVKTPVRSSSMGRPQIVGAPLGSSLDALPSSYSPAPRDPRDSPRLSLPRASSRSPRSPHAVPSPVVSPLLASGTFGRDSRRFSSPTTSAIGLRLSSPSFVSDVPPFGVRKGVWAEIVKKYSENAFPPEELFDILTKCECSLRLSGVFINQLTLRFGSSGAVTFADFAVGPTFFNSAAIHPYPPHPS